MKYIQFKMKTKIWAVLLLTMPVAAMAQQTAPEQAIKGDKDAVVTVISSYNPTLSDMHKINTSPSVYDTTDTKPELNYSISSKRVNTSIALENIKAAKFLGEPIDKLYNSYLKVGLGTFPTSYIDAYYNSLRSKESAYGIHVKSFNTFNQIKDYAERSSQGENSINLFGKKFYDRYTLAANVGYNYNFANFYGFKPKDFPELTYDKKDLRQHFNIFNWGISLYNNKIKDGLFNNRTNFTGYYWADKYKTNELNLKLDGDINLTQQFFKTSDTKQTLGVQYSLDYFHNGYDSTARNTGLLKLQPYIKLDFETVKLTAGLDFAGVFDTISPSVYLHPMVDVRVNLWENYLVLFGGITGETMKNTANMLTTANPYLKPAPALGYSNNRFSLYAGFSSSMWQNLDVKIYGQYMMYDNLALLLNDTNSFKNTGYYLNNQFKAIYDDANIVKLGAEAMYNNREDLSIGFAFNYYHYDMLSEEAAWHKSPIETSLMVRYSLVDKIIIKLNALYAGSMKAPMYNRTLDTPAFETVKVNKNGSFDLSLGAEYQYNKLLSAFINLNNITNSHYMQWNNYPVQGFNVMLGVTLNF